VKPSILGGTEKLSETKSWWDTAPYRTATAMQIDVLSWILF